MATHERNACTSHLVLVAPPISNTLAAQITKEDQAAIGYLKSSHFYMICGRPKATFGVVDALDDGFINIEIRLACGLTSMGKLYIPEMEFFELAPGSFKLQVKGDENHIKIFQSGKLVFATTPDDVLMRRGRKQGLVAGFDNFREMSTFDLLYVGIAKENQDSYSRLIERGHKARTDILAAEPQRFSGARVSDETYLLFFAVEPLIIRNFGPRSEFDDDDLDFSFDYHRIVADAEKAVISTFKPSYNKQIYANYPRGTDGLFNASYDTYIYSIAEGLAFNTLYGTFKGGRSSEGLLMSNDADFISVSGDKVELNISGKDFNIPVDSGYSEA